MIGALGLVCLLNSEGESQGGLLRTILRLRYVLAMIGQPFR